MEVVLQRLRDNDSTLETLDLRGNSLGEGFGVAVARALERNTTLTKLNLRNSGFEVETRKKIRQLLQGREAPKPFTEAYGIIKPSVAAMPRGTKRPRGSSGLHLLLV